VVIPNVTCASTADCPRGADCHDIVGVKSCVQLRM
jgi:hypothetical protein